jgi:hypothetical protein
VLGVGLQISDSGTDQNVVAGNLIGTDFTGAAALPNTIHGLRINNGPRYNLVGTDSDGVADEVKPFAPSLPSCAVLCCDAHYLLRSQRQ